MQDTELFELCKEVYKRTGWKLGFEGIVKDDYIPAYTSDYLLEKLPEELHKDGIKYYVTLSAKYGDEFKANYVSPSGYLYLFMEPEADTPLKSLLKLTIALDDVGELK